MKKSVSVVIIAGLSACQAATEPPTQTPDISQTAETTTPITDIIVAPLHYTESGDGFPVILLHGFMATGDRNWTEPGTTERLAQSFRVITLDLPGHGQSPKPHNPEAYGPQTLQDITTLMDSLSIETAHFVGYSTGGELAVAFAVNNPDRVGRAVIAGAGLVEAGSFKHDRWKKDAKNFGAIPAGASIADTIYADIPLPPDFKALIDSNDAQALTAFATGMDTLSVEADSFAANQTPMLMLIGEKDPFIALSNRAIEVRPDIAMTVIEGADHLSTVARPEFIDAIDMFLKAE